MGEYAIIGGYNTLEDWGIDLYDVEIGLPEVKTRFLELPLESGNIDLSEAVTGRPSYGPREIKLFLGKKDKFPFRWAEMITDIARAVHGKRLRIWLSFDPNYYYIGRISCETEKISYRRSIYTITAVCDPYKYYRDVTERTVTVDGTTDVTLDNMDMIVSPTFTTEANNITVSCNGEAALSIFQGTDFNIPEILLLPGENQLKFTGSGVVTIRYQEGTL